MQVHADSGFNRRNSRADWSLQQSSASLSIPGPTVQIRVLPLLIVTHRLDLR
jgi:hypothetical protein